MMELTNIPQHKRHVIFFANDSEVNGLYYSDEGKELLAKEELTIVPLSASEDFFNNFQIIGGVMPYNHMLLIISPNDTKKYSEVTDSTAYFALEKLNAIMRLCQYLGAKRVEIKNIYEEDNLSKVEGKVKVNLHAGNGDAKVSQQAKDALKRMIGYKSEYSGGKCDYDKAQLFLNKSRLAGDPFLSNLVEMRDPMFGDNNLHKMEQNILLSSSSQKTFNLLANLRLPAGTGTFKLNTENVSNKIYTLDIIIEF